MATNLISHNTECFALPPDFYPLPKQIVDSIKGNFVDYCYSEHMLQEVIKFAKRQNVSLVYERVIDNYGVLDYIIISRGRFLNSYTGEPVEEPMQLDKKKLPDGIMVAPDTKAPKRGKGSSSNKSMWKNFFGDKKGIIKI